MTPVVDAVVDGAHPVDNQKKIIGGRLKEARSALCLTQKELVSASGVPLPSLRDYELGNRIPGGDAVAALVRAGINANWLLTGEGEMLLQASVAPQADRPYSPAPLTAQEAPPATGYVALPLYNDVRAAAGHGAVVGHEHADDALMFKEDWIRFELGARPQDLCLIRVSGDSMEPTLRAGDVILIDVRSCHPDREGIYIMRLDGMLLVKRLQALPGGKLKVSSDNAAFDSWTVSKTDVGSDLVIVGRVVWSGRRL